MAAFHLAHGGRRTRGRPTTTAGVTRVLLRDRVSPRLTTSKRKERRREEKRSLRTRMEEAYFAARQSSWNGCRRVEKRSRKSGCFFQVQGPEVVEPLTPTSVPFRSDFEEGIRVIDQRCFSLLSHRQLFFSLNISRYMLTLLEII